MLNPLQRLRDRARGCIIGGALGDAMGRPFEGQLGPIRFQQHAEWSISDDSQLTLATCESIIEAGKVFAARLIELYTFDELLRMVIEAGGDTDTNASMTGQIAGTWIGAANIPGTMIELLPETTYIQRVAHQFADTVAA